MTRKRLEILYIVVVAALACVPWAFITFALPAPIPGRFKPGDEIRVGNFDPV